MTSWAKARSVPRSTTPASTTTSSSRRTPATCTATRRAARPRSTGSAYRHPDRQRQQQLLDRLDRALPRPPGRRVSGAVDCALAVGFEQMAPGALTATWSDRPEPFDRFDEVRGASQGASDAPMAARYFGGAGRRTSSSFGTQRPRRSRRSRSRRAPRGEQSVCGVPRTGHARGGHGLAGDLRPADPPACAARRPAVRRRPSSARRTFAAKHGIDAVGRDRAPRR